MKLKLYSLWERVAVHKEAKLLTTDILHNIRELSLNCGLHAEPHFLDGICYILGNCSCQIYAELISNSSC